MSQVTPNFAISRSKPAIMHGTYPVNYIAPPLRGINQRPIEFEYVRTEL